CWGLLSTTSSLLAATGNGVFCVDKIDGIPKNIYNAQTFAIISSQLFPGYTWCASGKGLVVLSLKNDHWVVSYTYEEINMDIRNIVEDPMGCLWLISAKGNIIKVEFPIGIKRPSIKQYELENRLYDGDIYMNIVEGHVIFASRKGLFRYNKQTDSFIPDQILGESFVSGPKAKPVFRIIQDKNKNIWFHSESRNYRAIPGPGKKFTIEDGPFRRIPIIQMNTIFPEEDGSNVWFAGTEGLIRYDKSVQVKWDKDFPTLICNMSMNETIPIYGGYAIDMEKQGLLIIPYKDRNVIFNCGAPFFEREAEILFSYKLDGFGDNWSEWTTESRKHFTNLDAGQYTFRVRAKNIYGIIGKEDSLSFKILPPWYRTWWALLLFAIGFSAVFFLLLNTAVKRRSIKLLREKERLEQVVADRTREIQDKNERLQEQSEKLKEMDEVKSRFFANISHEFRTPLTLIMSPLEQLLSRTRDEGFKKNYRLMLRNSQQLLALINRLLDLARFDSGKMKL
ncbi:MAG TPA: histidine kinase dimerization/phospho-acceptor domain-containing protein, partial [Candidatus Deferrimicrobium sp.]|nr:histidine kinase dimerization/phospho-acceptor domain-containing protein [Candidatus Deferrimicrobium sp.]